MIPGMASQDQPGQSPGTTGRRRVYTRKLKATVCLCCGRTFYQRSWQNRKYCPTRPGTIRGTTCAGMGTRLRNGSTRTGQVTFRGLVNTEGMGFLMDDPRATNVRRGEQRFLYD